MCNQTEAYLEMSRYDDQAARGEVHERGIRHEHSCLKCLREHRARQHKKNPPKGSYSGRLRCPYCRIGRIN